MRKDLIYASTLYALFFFLPVSISVSQLLLFILVIVFAASALTGKLNREYLKCFPDYLPFLLFLLFPLISFPNSQIMFKSLMWFKRHLYAIVLIALIPFFSALKEGKREKLLIPYFAGATLSSFIAVLQPFFGANLNKPFNLKTYYVFSTGLLSHPLTYAETTSFALIIGFVLFLKSKKTMVKLSLASAFVLNFLGLIFSREKMPIVASIVFVLLFLAISVFKFKKSKDALATILLFAIALTLIPDKQRVLWRFNPSKIKSSVSTRKAVWEKGIELFKNNPLTGSGFGTFFVEVDSWDGNRQKLFHAHNNLLEILATTGLIGLAAFLFFHLSLFKDFVFVLKNRFSLESLGIMFVFLLYHFEGLTECTFKDTELNLQLFSLLALFFAVNCPLFKNKNKSCEKEKPS